MLNFPQPPKSYGSVYLEDTDKSLPKKINLNTRYAMFSTIATGGKSLIKSCKDLHLCRFVCYKTLRPEFVDDEVEQQRLLREARVSAMLQHPNTVPTYELGRDSKGHYYFTMKLVHGYTLREILDFRERYDLTQLVDVIVQIGQALEYAHTHGVAHRDIKPENILVGPYGEVLLLDWGLAKVWNADGSTEEDLVSGDASEGALTITDHGKLQGTASYMSPEQINRDHSINHRTDVYSLGAILYEILTGRTPFVGEKVHQVISSTLNDDPLTPTEISSQHMPAVLEQVAMRCLQKDPDNRFDSMAHLLRELQQDWAADLMRPASKITE
jgi:serine/threonine protein kinase